MTNQEIVDQALARIGERAPVALQEPGVLTRAMEMLARRAPPAQRPDTARHLAEELRRWFYHLQRNSRGPRGLRRVDWRYDVYADRIVFLAELDNPLADECLSVRVPDVREANWLLQGANSFCRAIWRETGEMIDRRRFNEERERLQLELAAAMAGPPVIAFDPGIEDQFLTPEPRAIGVAAMSPYVADHEAVARGEKLLREWLSPAQREEYERSGCFDVKGSHSGRRYRITPKSSFNVEELDKESRCADRLCFLPKGHLVMGDMMLAQKIALETDEKAALKVANRAVVRASAPLWVERAIEWPVRIVDQVFGFDQTT